jgi:putative FmdB family regulatory protein
MAPTYSYRCDACKDGEVHEISKSIKEYDKDEACPKCQAVMVRHYAGKAPPVHFKPGGTGWYHQVYGKGKNPGNK